MCAVLSKHAGLAAGQMPPLVETMAPDPEEDDEYDEDHLPELVGSDDMITEEDTEETEENIPTSVVQLGAPPPLPPPLPATAAPAVSAAEEEEDQVEYDEYGDQAEYDENGVRWALACQPPSDTWDTTEIEAGNSGYEASSEAQMTPQPEEGGQPGVQLGFRMSSPISPSSFLGMLSPSTSLTDIPISPIQIEEDEIEEVD